MSAQIEVCPLPGGYRAVARCRHSVTFVARLTTMGGPATLNAVIEAARETHLRVEGCWCAADAEEEVEPADQHAGEARAVADPAGAAEAEGDAAHL